MSDVTDVAALLTPLRDGVEGAGEDLRRDFTPSSPYQRLRDSRADARNEERSRDVNDDANPSVAEGWRDVLQIAGQALATRSKDFEIAAWFTEALVRTHGLGGITTGAMLLTGLCQLYWEGGYPQPDDEGYRGRTSPIGGLSGGEGEGTVLQPLRRLVLFRRADGSPVSLYQWDQADLTAGLPEARRQARYAAGVPELAVLEAEARADRAFLSEVARQAAGARDAWRALDEALTERAGKEAPSLRKVADILDRIGAIAERVLRVDAPASPAQEGGFVEIGTMVESVPENEPSPGHGDPQSGREATLRELARLVELLRKAEPSAPLTQLLTETLRRAHLPTTELAIQSRDDALQQLEKIAGYFRQTEPHSPLAYTLEEAVRRGRMTLAELLVEVLPQSEARVDLLARLGIRPTEKSQAP